MATNIFPSMPGVASAASYCPVQQPGDAYGHSQGLSQLPTQQQVTHVSEEHIVESKQEEQSVLLPPPLSLSVCRVFVSHSSKDDDFGTKLTEDLRHVLGAGAVWYDSEGGLNPGDRWFRRIEEELVGRNIFLIILSPHSMDSDWVRCEFDIALNEKKPIVPVLYQSCNIWPYLKTVHYISFLPPKSYEVAFDKLLKALSVVCQKTFRI